MNSCKLITALIVALTIMAAFFVGLVISNLLFLLPYPIGHIANGIWALAGLTAIAYIWISKPEKKKRDDDGDR